MSGGKSSLAEALDGGQCAGTGATTTISTVQSDSMSAKEAITFTVLNVCGSGDENSNKDNEHFLCKPEFTHQTFGDSETMRGWRTGEISLNFRFDPSRLFQCSVMCRVMADNDNFTSNGHDRGQGRLVSKTDTHGGKRDDVLGLLEPLFEDNFKIICERSDLQNAYDTAGNLDSVEAYDRLCVDDMTTLGELQDGYKIVCFRLGPNSHASVRKLHTRLESFIYFYIDGASAIDSDDDKWHFIMISKFKILPKTNSSIYAVVESVAGFTTVYSFYSYPTSVRLRLSQCLVLPPFQKKGYGSAMIQAVYALGYQLSSRSEDRKIEIGNMSSDGSDEGKDYVLDVTVEDPTDYLQFLQVKVDVERITGKHSRIITENFNHGYIGSNSEFGFFIEEKLKQALDGILPTARRFEEKENLETNLKRKIVDAEECSTESASWRCLLPKLDTIERAQSHLKINPRQFRRCWECLLMRAIHMRGEDQRKSLLPLLKQMIKQRIHAEQFAKLSNKRNEKTIVDTETGFVMLRFNSKRNDDIKANAENGSNPNDSEFSDCKRARLQERMTGMPPSHNTSDEMDLQLRQKVDAEEEEKIEQRRQLVNEMFDEWFTGLQNIVDCVSH